MLFVGGLGCRERFEETPNLAKARAMQSSGAAGGHVTRVTSPPPGFENRLTGGEQVFADDFERAQFGDKWQVGAKSWRLVDGTAINRGSDNKGLWLLEPLPEGDCRIEYDVRSDSFSKKEREGTKKEVFPGDNKCEAFNMTPEHQTGYVFIFGGWSNRINRIARLEEHGDGAGARIVDGPLKKVEPGKTYRMKILRIGNTMAFYADDEYLVHMTDKDLIRGPHFGFNNWRSALTFDNLAVYKL